MDGESAALASTAAATLVALLTTEAWARAKSEIVAVWRRFRPAHADAVEADLTQAHEEAVAGDEAVARTLTAEWESRLGRLLTADPDAATELRRVTDALAKLVEQQPTTITQQAKASGHGTVIQVGRDARIGDVMLNERQIQVQRASATDAAVIIQVGRDLYVSDPALSALWVPGETKPGECPFPGLDAFGPGQAQWFFGRQKLTGDLLQVLDETGPGLVLVVGPSGAGKSSLLGAGLLAAIGEGRLPVAGAESWPRLMITPGAHPAQTLRDALATAQAQDATTRTIVVVDQLEEIFTACGDEDERAEFLDGLDSSGGYVIAGLRADFYERATGYPVLRAAMQSRQLVLGAMTPAEVRDAIALPTRSVGLTLDDGLVERLLRDLGVDETGGYEAGRLPLLAHALRATWQRRSGDRLTIEGYEATGGIHGAIAKTAEDVYARLDETGQETARRLFLSLVRIGDGEATTDTRRRVSTENLYAQVPDPDATRTVLAAYTDARLLTSGGQAVEITHEALLRRWPRLREWIDEDRSGNLVRQGVEEAAAAWDQEGRDPAALYGGVRLAAARSWTADPGHERELSPPARDFLTASDHRRRRGVRRRNEIIAALTALVVALGFLTGFAFVQRHSAQQNFHEAQATVFANEAEAALADNRPDTAMEFALEAEELDHSALGVLTALLSTQTQPITGRLTDTDGYVMYGVTYSPNGALIATSSYHGYVMLWNAASRRQLAKLPMTFGAGYATVHAAAFSPDSKTLAATAGGGAWLWNVADPSHPVREAILGSGGKTYASTAVAFSPDGRTLAVAETTAGGTAGPVFVYNVSTRTVEHVFTPVDSITSLGFAGNGRYLVTAASVGDGSGPVQLWDLSRPGTIVPATVGSDAIGKVAVSPDGQTIAFPLGSSDNIQLWNLSTHQATTVTTGFSNTTDALAFSADDGYLAAGSVDGTVKLWDLRSGPTPVLLDTLAASRSGVYAVAFAPGGSTLASTDENTTALWDVRGTTVDGRANSSAATVFSSNGRLLAVGTQVMTTTGAVQVVKLYDMPSRRLIATLPAGPEIVTYLAFSPNGQTLAAAVNTSPATVEMWNVPQHRQIGVIAPSQAEQIHGMAFSPNGRLLVTTSLGSPNVQLWSATRLTQVAMIHATQDSIYTLETGQWGVAFSPDGQLLAVGGADGLTRVYTLSNDKLVGIYVLPSTTHMWTLAFSPVGRTLAVANNYGSIYLYDNVGPSSTLVHSYTGLPIPDSSQTVTSLAFEPGGKELIAADADGTVRVWNVANRALDASFQASTDIVNSVSYSASADTIVTASNVTRIWETKPQEVAASICPTLRAPVDPGLWTEYISQYPYTPVC
ncbi:MAG: hypothetical protein ABSA93_00850 [Streptosporangiaceae bacterium]